MLKLTIRTRTSPQGVVEKALKFFGPGGYGLRVTEQSENCASLKEGVVGSVFSPIPTTK